jgi:hypothetical protein
VRIFEDRFWIANLGLRAIETRKPILDCAEIETPDPPNPGLTFPPPADNLDIRSASPSPFEASGVKEFPNPKSKIQNRKGARNKKSRA